VKEEVGRQLGAVLEKYNIRDTKRFFSEVNRKALEGLEVITYDGLRPNQGEVSHIKTEVLDKIVSAFEFHPEWTLDEELSVWTVSLPELPGYGEGEDRKEAAEDLIDGLLEYVEAYYGNLQWFLNREETASDLRYLRQIARCEGDRARIARLVGLPDAD